VLEGGLRKAGSRIRVTAQLVETDTGNHLWAERYDRDLADIFGVQDEITEAVAIAIAPAIADAELRRAMRRPPESLDAWAAYQRGLWHLSKATPNDNSLAEKFFQQAIDLEPNFSGGYQGLAFVQNQTRGDRLEGLKAVEALARRAVALDPANAEARSCLAMALYKRADYEGALAEIEYALVKSPNLAIAHGISGAILAYSGCPKRGAGALERNVRLDPRDPQLAIRLNQLTLAHYLSREYTSAVEVAKRTMRSYPIIRMFAVGSRPPPASLAEPTKQGKRWRKPLRCGGLPTTCLCATACPGCGRKTTPTCLRGCARRECRRWNRGLPCRVGIA
jgi:adenylate cyclase